MLIVNTDRIQVLMINFKQQIRLAASPNAGDDLDHPILFLGYQLIQILLSFNHGKPPHASKIRIYTFSTNSIAFFRSFVNIVCGKNSYLYLFIRRYAQGTGKTACPFSIGTIPKNTAVC